MPKWQPLCFIIYVMTINLVNHKNFGGWTWRLIDFWDFHLSRCHGDNPKQFFLQNHGSKIIVVNYFQWWLNNEQVCKFTLCNNAKETTLEKLSATHQPLESFMKAQPYFRAIFIELWTMNNRVVSLTSFLFTGCVFWLVDSFQPPFQPRFTTV